MGMFNTIVCDMHCPRCGAFVEWQSKFARVAGEEVGLSCDRIPIADISIGELYTLCDKCGAWSEGEITDGKPRDIVTTDPARRAV